MAKVIIVNKDDEPIELKERGDISKDDIYRISGLWVTNSKGQALLAQRKLDKKIEPGCWGPAAAGTNEEGDTYETNIYKEAEEELGLVGRHFKEFRYIKAGEVGNYFVKMYLAVLDLDIEKDIHIQEDEVERVVWVDPIELATNIKKNPSNYVKSAPHWQSWGLLG